MASTQSVAGRESERGSTPPTYGWSHRVDIQMGFSALSTDARRMNGAALPTRMVAAFSSLVCGRAGGPTAAPAAALITAAFFRICTFVDAVCPSRDAQARATATPRVRHRARVLRPSSRGNSGSYEM